MFSYMWSFSRLAPGASSSLGASNSAGRTKHASKLTADLSAPSASTSTRSVTCEGVSKVVSGRREEPFAELHFKLQTSRNATCQAVKLALDQVDFGIRNCCSRGCSYHNQACDERCSPHFIQKVTIQARPKFLPTDRLHRVQMEPQHTCQVFGKQRSSSRNLQVPLFNPKQTSVGFQDEVATSQTVSAYGWDAAIRDRDTGAVTWRWAISHLADGSELRLGETRMGKPPFLPICPAFFQMNSKSFKAEATWEWTAPPRQDEVVPQEWEVTVVISRVFIEEKKSFWGRLLGQFQFVEGDSFVYVKPLSFQ